MNALSAHDPLGMKWYTFYTKVRPWILLVVFLLSIPTYGESLVTLMDISLVGASVAIPVVIYVIADVAYIIANIVLLFKTREESQEMLFAFIRRLLIFELFFFSYTSMLTSSLNSQNIATCLFVLLFNLLLFYFVWYRLNIKYFKKRLVPWELDNAAKKAAPARSRHITSSFSAVAELSSQSSPQGTAVSDTKPNRSDTAPIPDAEPERDNAPAASEIPAEAPQPAVSFTPAAAQQQPSAYAKYCSRCGSGIDPVTKVCTGCGKQYFKGIPLKTAVMIALCVLLAASVGLNVYTYSSLAKAQETIMALSQRNNAEFSDNKYFVESGNSSTALSYAVTLNSAGGSGGSSCVIVKKGSSMPTATAPSKSGYVFMGFYSSRNGAGTKYYDANMRSVHAWDQASPGTLYAYWEEKEEVKFSSNASAGDDVYVDIVSIFPEIGIYTQGSTNYSNFVCSCKTSSGATVWVYMTCSEYRSHFDFSASTSIYNKYADEKTFSSKRIHGIAKRAESIMSGLSSDTRTTMVIDFESVG